jgi:hypothetical protein
MTDLRAPSEHIPLGSRASYWRLHVLLSLISLDILLLSVNRRGSFTLAFVSDNQFLRWTEINNMVLGLLTVLLYFLVAGHLANGATKQRRRAQQALSLVFVVGAYLYALSYGNHEITNYLHGRFCATGSSRLCEIVAFNDDTFSDFLFLAGFTVLNLVVMLTQVIFPAVTPLRVWDNVLLTGNALFVSAGIAANLAFEKAEFDPYVVGAVAVLALVLLKRSPGQPMLRYYSVAYVAGIVVTVAIKLT